MSRVKVNNEIRIYEQNGRKTDTMNGPKLTVRSHPIHSERVILLAPDGEAYTVIGADLATALQNAQNTR